MNYLPFAISNLQLIAQREQLKRQDICYIDKDNYFNRLSNEICQEILNNVLVIHADCRLPIKEYSDNTDNLVRAIPSLYENIRAITVAQANAQAARAEETFDRAVYKFLFCQSLKLGATFVELKNHDLEELVDRICGQLKRLVKLSSTTSTMSTPVASSLSGTFVIDDTVITPARRAIPNGASFTVYAHSSTSPAISSYPHLSTIELA